jgi:DNA-directed RNA polymerase specialized sigma24 family protein
MLLRERLARSGARVIVTSSMAHTSRRANVDLDDLTFERSYRALDAYATTKLENVLFIRELARRWDPLGSRSAAVHPGMVRSRCRYVSVACAAHLRPALQRLPRRLRTLVVLRYVDGLPDAEMARVLGCSERKVRADAAEAAARLVAR